MSQETLWNDALATLGIAAQRKAIYVDELLSLRGMAGRFLGVPPKGIVGRDTATGTFLLVAVGLEEAVPGEFV